MQTSPRSFILGSCLFALLLTGLAGCRTLPASSELKSPGRPTGSIRSIVAINEDLASQFFARPRTGDSFRKAKTVLAAESTLKDLDIFFGRWTPSSQQTKLVGANPNALNFNLLQKLVLRFATEVVAGKSSRWGAYKLRPELVKALTTLKDPRAEPESSQAALNQVWTLAVDDYDEEKQKQKWLRDMGQWLKQNKTLAARQKTLPEMLALAILNPYFILKN